MKIRSSLILILSCFILLPAIVFAVVANIQMKSVAFDNFVNATKSITEHQANNIAEYFTTLADEAEKIAADPAFKSNSDEDFKNLISAYDAIIPEEGKNSPLGITRIIITDKNGKPQYVTGGIEINEAMENAVSNIISQRDDNVVYCYSSDITASAGENERESVDPIFPSKNATDTTAKLMIKAKSGDRNVLVFFNGDRLKNFRVNAQFSNNSRLILIDSTGAIIDGAYVGNVSTDKNKPYGTLVEAAQSGTATRKDSFQGNDANNLPTVGFTMKVNNANDTDMGWTVALVAEEQKAYSASGAAEGTMITTIVLSSIVLIAAAVVLVIIITKPIKNIEETLIRVRRGDYDARINLIGNNEYGEIARAFNDLIDDIIVSEGRYRTIIDMSDNIIFEWKFKKNEVIFSNNFNKKFSYRAPSDHFGDSFLLKVKVHPDDSDRYHKDLERLSKGENFTGNEYRWKNIYGDYIWVLVRTAIIRDREGNIAKIVGVIVDIDRAKKSEQMLVERASFDSLTGLYNRESIERTIDNEIELINARKQEFAILFIDVDDFKIFNDKYSHATGDQVLKFVANTINKTIDGFGTAGRYGGDEFVACVRNIEVNDPSEVAKKILTDLQEGFVSDNGEKLSVNTSIGISIIRDSSMRVDEIIGMADDAMYKIKKNGKSNYGILNRENVRKTPAPKPEPEAIEPEPIVAESDEPEAEKDENENLDA